MQTENGSSSNEQEVVLTQPEVSGDVNTIIEEIKKSGMSQKLWGALCFAAASTSNGSAVNFRQTLIEHLTTIGFDWRSLFCHVQKAGTFYRNAWAGHYYYVNLKIGEFKYAGFLTY